MSAAKFFRKGDIVTVQAEVRYDHYDTSDIALNINGGYSAVYAKIDEVEMVTPVLQIGDVVTWHKSLIGGRSVHSGTVLALKKDFAWIEDDDSGFCTHLVTILSRTNPPSIVEDE